MLYIVREGYPAGDQFDAEEANTIEEARAKAEASWNHMSDYDRKRQRQWIDGYNGYSSLKEFRAAMQDEFEMPDPDYYEETHGQF